MRDFSILTLGLILMLGFFMGCESSAEKKELCPQCNMLIPDSKEHTSHLDKEQYFDDMGCLILWAEEAGSDASRAKVFSLDTEHYISANNAFYTINEKTPMGYGFSAYEHHQEESIPFDEMRLRMLRGEHMANPKIRKQILGE